MINKKKSDRNLRDLYIYANMANDILYNLYDYAKDELHLYMERKNEIMYEKRKSKIKETCMYIKRCGGLGRYVLGKIFAIAMLVVGINFMVAHFNKVLPFGIMSENVGLWLIWAYSGWFIGECMIIYGAMKLFELTIERWLSTL